MTSEFAPTPGQQAVITAPLGPMLVSAGAGTGKTTVMAQRILHLLESGQARAPEILGLTFTNKAAANLKEKVRTTLAPGAPAEDPEHLDVFVTTYHSFGAGLVADHGGLIGLPPTTRVLDRAQARQLLYSVLDDLTFEHRSVIFPDVAIDAALDLADRCANRLVDVADVIADSHRLIERATTKAMASAARARLELCQLASAYRQRKRACDLIDYGDQVALAVELMSRHPELARAYRQLHPVVLLDEYQDTNLAQRRLLELVYPPGSAVCAVGDDMQSIYAFRGAHRQNILGFHQHFGAPVAPELANLEVTFRFGPRLVKLANRLQGQVADALPKRLEVPVGGEVVDTTIECFLAGDAEEEAATIAADIAATGAPWSANAILCRKRRLIPAVVDALLAAGVPVEVAGGSGLLERPEVIEVLATLQLLADPDDTVAFIRLVGGTRFALAMGDVAALARHARRPAGEEGVDDGHGHHRGVSLLAAARQPEQVPGLSAEARDRLEEFTAGLDQLADLAARMALPDLVEQVIEQGDLWQAGGERGRENLLRLVALAEEFEPVEGRANLAELVEYAQILADTGEAVAEATDVATDAVRVLTVHQAKGLEFDSVFVPGLAGSSASQIFPDSRADNPTSNSAAVGWWLTGNDEGLPDPLTTPLKKITDELRRRQRDEEWRLLYVACTRARRKLVVSAAHWYLGTDMSRTREPQGPSDFYEFVAAQDDLVHERFRRPVPAERLDTDRPARPVAVPYPASVDPDGQQLSLVELPAPPRAEQPAPPARLSVTGLVTYRRCPRQFLWSFVRPLPRRVRASAALGAEVHRWIQRRADPQLVLVDSPPAGAEREAAGPLQDSFLSSVYAELDPVRVEVPVSVDVGEHRVHGRVDAVYERDGMTEIVDFKTGRAPQGREMDDDVALQLRLYGIAACRTWGIDPDRLRLSACHLRAGGEAVVRSVSWDEDRLEEAVAEVSRFVGRIAAAAYEAAPGPRCGGCDFLAVCREGQALVYESR